MRKLLQRRGVVINEAALAGVWGSHATAEASPQFVTTTSHAAVSAVAGNLASGAVVSGQALALTKGAINMLYWAKMKVAVASLAMLLIAGAVIGKSVHARQTETVAVATVPARSVAYVAPATVITGVITNVQEGQITLMRRTGAVTVTIDKATVIKVDDMAADAGALKVGMDAAAFTEDGKPATEIRARSPRPRLLSPGGGSLRAVTGLVSRVDASSITVQPRNVSPVILPIAATTVVSVDDKPAGASDLKAGMSVGVLFMPDTPAAAIFAFTTGGPTTPR
jgi:hypothetical protein